MGNGSFLTSQESRPMAGQSAGGKSNGAEGNGSRVFSAGENVSRLDRWLVGRFLHWLGNSPFTIELWNGERVTTPQSRDDVVLRVADRSSFRRLIRDPFFQFGECYSTGTLELRGISLVNFLRMLDDVVTSAKRRQTRPRRYWPFGRSRNTLAGSQKNIHHHYDIGNSFYELWLDRQLLYTCAYFPEPGMSLEEAQVAKMDHVCRKVRLKAGETVIEAGCGWGAFALHMARHYGVRVKAFNISREQVKYARRRAEKEGLQDRVEFILDDWRNITGRCDVFVSIGMLEHVGPENYAQLGHIIRQSLQAGGRGLIHSIGQNQPRPFDRWIEERIFPGAYPPTLAEMMQIFETNELSVLDVENLRLHYAETLAHWLQRFEDSAGTVAEMFDEQFVRMWRLYLAGSFAAFESDRLQLYQALFSPEKENGLPRNRQYQFGEKAATERPCCFPVWVDAVTVTEPQNDKLSPLRPKKG